MSLDDKLNDLNYQTGENEEVGDFSIITPDQVDEILSIEKCPNCPNNLVNGKCEDKKNCGYGWGEDAFGKKLNRKNKNREDYYVWKQNLSNSLEGSGKHIEMELFNGKTFTYIDYKNRLDSEKQELLARIKYDGKVFEIFASYFIKEIGNYVDDEKVRKLYVDLLKHPDVKEDFKKSKILLIYKDKKSKKTEKINGFLDYKVAEEIIKKILVDRFKIYG